LAAFRLRVLVTAIGRESPAVLGATVHALHVAAEVRGRRCRGLPGPPLWTADHPDDPVVIQRGRYPFGLLHADRGQTRIGGFSRIVDPEGLGMANKYQLHGSTLPYRRYGRP